MGEALPQLGESAPPIQSRWWILIVVSSAQLMLVLDTTIMLIALPSAQRSLGFSTADRQWIITAYTLGFGGLLLLGGRISDMIGTKRTLQIGIVGFAVASALGGAARTTAILIAARGLQGAFGALVAPSTLSILSTTFTEVRERGKAFGVYAAMALSGGALGMILGGVLTQYLNWRWCLFVNLPISALVSIGVLVLVPRGSGHPEVKLDIPGTVLGCGGLIALVYGLGEASTLGWSSTAVVVSLVLSVLLLGSFILLQTNVANPLLPLRVLTERNRAGSFLILILDVGAVSATYLFISYLLQTVLHFSPMKTGLAFLPLLVVNALTATQVASRLLRRVPTRALIIPGLLITAMGMLILSQLSSSSDFLNTVLPAECCFGLGQGFVYLSAISTATNHAEPRDAGITSATANTAQQVGTSAGTALLNTVAVSAASAYLLSHPKSSGLVTDASLHGFATSSRVAVLIIVAAAVIGGLLIDAHPKQDEEERMAVPSVAQLEAEL
jgi:EmrB/QacA subfamily drug resistance transporter